jgi:uncharacterized protein
MQMNRRYILLAAVCMPQLAQAAKPAAAEKLIAAAESQIGVTVRYSPAYEKLRYPLGDVALERGVCTDVVIRAYRKGLGVDLQALVHEDMAAHFDAYPRRWGATRPDSNIDHRRVPNLQRFFQRQGAELSSKPLLPGDVVSMMLPGNLPHIAIVSAARNQTGNGFLAVHNIGAGAQREDILEMYPLTGHYRYLTG